MIRIFISVIKSNLFWFVLTISGIFFVCNNTNFINKGFPGFVIKKIEFDGNEKVPEALLYKASGLRYKANIFRVSVEEVKRKLEQIAWVRSVEVRRKLPDRFYIRVIEREPIAILQSKYKLHLLDKYGTILEHDGIGNFGSLPILVGEGCANSAQHLLFVLNQFPKIRRQLVCATFIGKRRWDIKINRGLTVKLPERHLKYAFSILEEISDDNGFFKNDIQEIDLRMLDRVIVKKKDSGL